MAESIVRLRVESQEFESKLKRASQELLAMADNARRTGATFAIADKEELAFVQSLGQLQTSARSAKGQIAEMTKAFQDLSMHYRSLTAEEKAAPYGQELKKSLEQLQQRINDGKQALGEINGKIGESKGETNLLSGAVNELTGKLGINIPKLGAMSIAIAGVTGALKVAKDAFFASEANIDEWGRVMDQSKALYEGFLTALNTGDISGFLSRIDQIINAARNAYDELDRLSTQKAIDSPRLKSQQTENERFRAMLRTGRYIAPNDGRKPSMAEGTVLSQSQLEKISVMLQNGMKSSNTIVKEEIIQTKNAINALYTKEAVNLGMSVKEFRAGTSSMAEFDKRIEGYNKYVEYQKQIDNARRSVAVAGANGMTVDEKTYQMARQSNPYAQYKAWGVFKDDGETYTKIVELFDRMTSLQTQNYGNTAQMYRGINRVEGVTVGSGRGGGGSTGGSGSVIDVEKFAFKMDEKFNGGMLQDEINGQVANTISEALAKMIKADLQNMDPEKLKAMLQGTETLDGLFRNAPMTSAPPEIQSSKGKSGMDEIGKAAKTFGAMGNIMSALQNMGIKLPEGLQKTVGMMQSLISVIQSVQSVVQMFATSSQAANTVAVGANTVALGALTGAISANTAINAIPFFAGGGVVRSVSSHTKRFAGGGIVDSISHHAANGFVGGNNYSGDLIPIAVNSGELILNKAQQGNLASQLSEGSSFANLNIEKRITAEDIRLVLNNSRRRRSRGETL